MSLRPGDQTRPIGTAALPRRAPVLLLERRLTKHPIRAAPRAADRRLRFADREVVPHLGQPFGIIFDISVTSETLTQAGLFTAFRTDVR
jgi:hypothetical protein